MQMRPEAQSTTTSISGSKQDAPQRHWPAGAPVPCRRSLFGGRSRSRGDAFGDHDITSCRFNWRSPAYYACAAGRRTGLCTIPSISNHRIVLHIIAPATRDGLLALPPRPAPLSPAAAPLTTNQGGSVRPEASAKTSPQQLKKSQPTAAARTGTAGRPNRDTATGSPSSLALHCTARHRTAPPCAARR